MYGNHVMKFDSLLNFIDLQTILGDICLTFMPNLFFQNCRYYGRKTKFLLKRLQVWQLF